MFFITPHVFYNLFFNSDSNLETRDNITYNTTDITIKTPMMKILLNNLFEV